MKRPFGFSGNARPRPGAHRPLSRDPRGHLYTQDYLTEKQRSEILAFVAGLHPIWEFRYPLQRTPPVGQTQRRLLRPVYWLGNWQFACLEYYRPPKGIHDRCVAAEPFPPVLQSIARDMERRARTKFPREYVPAGFAFNTCLVNFYGNRLEDGRFVDGARVGEHRDFEPGPVGSLSIGERALFQFVTSKRIGERDAPLLSQWLDDGSLQLFAGPTYKDRVFHRVQRVAKETGIELPPELPDFRTRRINFTFRFVPPAHVIPFEKLAPTAQDDILPYMQALAEKSRFFARALERSGEEAVIRLDSVSKQHGRQILFLEASMSVFKGEKVGLVGPNGAGKSTIFRMIVREEEADIGQVVVDRGVRVGYFSQNIGEMSGRSVVEETMAGAGEVSDVARELHLLEQAMADPSRGDELEALIERFGTAQARFDELGGYALEARAREILAGLGFEAAVMDGDVAKLSGGWKMRVGLARILLMRPDALLLDEPTNHLDIESIIWLEQFLRGFEGALIMTSHDREFLNRLVDKIVEIDGGDLTTFSGNYDAYVAQRAVLQQQQEAQFARQQAMLAKEQAFIDKFKARASHAAQVQSRVKKLEKIERVEPPKKKKTLEFDFRPPPRSGDDVAKLEHVKKAYGERVIYAGLDLLIRRGERWCVMGVNGAGKSTLLKLVSQTQTPDQGAVSVGASVKLGYFAQHAMELLEPEKTVLLTLQEAFPFATLGSLKSLAGAFGFSGDEVEKTCDILSGGEKARLVLAKMLYDPPNFLVLDEPTNHLDMDTKDMLMRALEKFEGTMLFVSHDRAFLSALSNRVLELTPDGVHKYGGGYKEYVAQSGHEAPGLR